MLGREADEGAQKMGEWWLPYGFISEHVNRRVILFTVCFSIFLYELLCTKPVLNTGFFSFLYKYLYYCLNTQSGFLMVCEYRNETKINLTPIMYSTKTKMGSKLELVQS